MALTRKFLKALGIEEEKIDQIIEEHTAVADRMNGEIEKYKADAKALSDVQKELDGVRAELEAAKDGGWEEKHDALKKEFEDYKNAQTAKESRAAKEAAVRAYYESKGITGERLAIAMKGSGEEIEALQLGEDGKIKDAGPLDTLIDGTFKGLVGTVSTSGVKTANPPANTGGGNLTKADIYKKDDKGRYLLSASERQKALMENQIM